MGEIIKLTDDNQPEQIPKNSDLVELSDELLDSARAAINRQQAYSVPVAELATLGAGIASLIPALNTITQSTTVASDGLYMLVNAGVGDALKVAKNGNLWGAIKTADGASKMAQFQAAGPLTATTTATAINPAIMLMAVAVFAVEKEMKKIADTEKQILDFMEREKESEIESDLETLMSIIADYKNSWDNEQYINSNHSLVLHIQKVARKNINDYQKIIKDIIGEKKILVAQANVYATLEKMVKQFQYYRLSLYTFSLASMLEVMLSGNFNEGHISLAKDEITERSLAYRDLFEKASVRLEKMGNAALEANVVKGIGTTGKAVGKLIGSIPLVKEGPVDEMLHDAGSKMQRKAVGMEKKAVKSFAKIGNPGTSVFVEKLDDMVQIYNHTSNIFLDKNNIYLLA